MSIATSRGVRGRLLTLCVLSGAACESQDLTRVALPSLDPARAPPVGAAGSTSSNVGRWPEGADAGTMKDAGAPCAGSDAGPSFSVQLSFQELYQTSDCTFFSSPLSGGLAFTLGTEGKLTNGADLRLELGASSFVWSEGAFRRSLECGDTDQPWRFSESIHGTWSAGEPFVGCADPLTRFTGSYHYEECIALPDGGCGRLPGSCSQFAVVEISIGQGQAGSSPLGGAGTASCRPISARCGGVKCARAGQPCQASNDCELGLVCVAESCGMTGTCQTTLDCPLDAEPVCACNGRDYPSACAAHNSGQGVAQTGPCPSGESDPPFLLDPELTPIPLAPPSGALSDAGTAPLPP